LTLIEAETLAAILSETGVTLDPAEHRRNITTRAIALDPLIGQRFRIGEVICEGVRDCPPCNHLEDVTGKKVMKPLIHRGGIRARIVESGLIRVGDLIQQI
jgi:MOSC domain-containing protein YiiM